MSDKCVESSPECRGEVYSRPAPSGSGFFYTRCDHHQDKTQKIVDEIEERYPITSPGWFDPTAAGERWDDED
ncbi:hypothetical protein AN220_00695 [Streptomyces nanshensis]|nr:hypothetical protein AN220_00695 [Streptomyces nanshensis]